MSISTETTLAELVTEDPRRADILEARRLDFCCGGAKSLGAAALEAGVDLEALIGALDLPPVQSVEAAGPGHSSALAHDIVDTRRAYMWEEMPRLAELVEKVYRVHGDRHPELREVTNDYQLPADACTSYQLACRRLEEMERDLHVHIHKENNVLFPAALQL